jgi:short-subunit dehydrogenase
MEQKRRRTALITGASAGIGAAFARLLAAEGFDLVLVARRKERLDALASELGERYAVRCHALPTDLADTAAVGRIASQLDALGIEVDVLVANAGYAITERFTEVPWRTHADFIQVMATGVAELCHRFAPGMVERRWGRIVNVSSLAAVSPDLPGSLYGGVKSFVVGLSETLAQELAGTGVHVSALCPGFTLTEFHDVMRVREQIDELPGFMFMDADDVVREGWEAVERGDPICISGAVNRALAGVVKILPRGVLRAVASRRTLRRDGSA